MADANRAGYIDEALRVAPREDETLPDFVQAFADKIPQTHGAPIRKAAVMVEDVTPGMKRLSPRGNAL